MKLSNEQKHVLKVIKKESGENGWATVSDVLFQLLSLSTPPELARFEMTDNGGRACLTEDGEHVLRAMEWIDN